MKNTFGSDLSLTIFGESHGRAVGAVLDGMAAGVPVDEAFVAACMDKRRARGDGIHHARHIVRKAQPPDEQCRQKRTQQRARQAVPAA